METPSKWSAEVRGFLRVMCVRIPKSTRNHKRVHELQYDDDVDDDFRDDAS
jgi:hypothetical protein